MLFRAEQDATPGGRRWSAFLLLWAALIVTRWEVLDSPPYWDAGLGIWSEADGLIEERFNLWHHLFREPTHLLGGRAVYRFSLLPPLIACAQLLVPWTRGVLVLGHLASLALGSLAAVVLYRLLLDRAGAIVATLAAGCLLTSPIFSTQLDIPGSDLPPAVCGLVCVALLDQKRWLAAVALGILAFLLKPPGILVLAAVVGSLAARLLVERWSARRPADPQRLRALGMGLLAMLAAWCLMRIDSQALARFVGLEPRRLEYFVLWCPELLALGGLCAGFAAWQALSTIVLRSRPTDDARCEPRSDREHRLSALGMAAFLVAGTVAYCTITPALPRYTIYAIPPGWFLVGSLLSSRREWLPSAALLLAGLLGWNLANWDGALAASVEAAAARQTDLPGVWFRGEGSLLERSRAYLPDHRATIAALARVEATWDGYPVFAAHPYVHFLTIPRLGYVSRCLPAYKLTAAGEQSRGAQMAVWEALADPPPEPVFVVGRDLVTFYWNHLAVPPVEPGDEIVFDDPSGGPLVFRKRWGGRIPDAAQRRQWLVARLWPHPVPRESLAEQPVRQARFRASRLAWIGERAAAAADLRAALTRVPDDPVLVELLGRVESGAPVEPWSSW